MKVKTKLSKDKYDHNKDSETHLLVELKAPKVEWDKDRAPICIVPVIDVSGSMRGANIDYVKKACRKLIDHLSPGDFAGLVAFDSVVHPIAPIREVTQSQKEELKASVAKLRAGFATNMSGGLLQGLQWINEQDLPENVVLRILLFTDGYANTGIATGNQLPEFLKKHKGRATVSCFGFGTNCAQDLLADMSSLSDGNYAYIDSPDAALTAFARELGGLMSTYGQNIRVDIKPDKNNKVLEILNDEDVSEKDGSVVVELRDILGEEQKFIVASIKLSQVEKAFPRKLTAFKVNVSFLDRNGKTEEVKEHLVKVKFCRPGEEPKENDSEVVRYRDRLLAGRAQDQAEIFVKSGDYAAANALLLNCESSLVDSEVKNMVGALSVNYACSADYSANSGMSNSARTAFKGKRLAYTSDSLSRKYGSTVQTQSTSMDAMEAAWKGKVSTTSDVVDNDGTSNDGTSNKVPDVIIDIAEEPNVKPKPTISTTKKRSDGDW